MSTKELLLQYLRYNQWANKRIADVLAKTEPTLLDKEIKSSFPTLRKTVHHIWDAELTWMSRMKKETLQWPPTAEFKNAPIHEFTNTSNEFVEYVSEKDEEFFTSATTYHNSKGQPYITPNSDIIMHCMNHGTFHRGQLVTMLREAGISKLPSTDFITFVRQQ